MSNQPSEVLEKLQRAFQKFSEYAETLKNKSGNTKVETKHIAFNVSKQGSDYNVVISAELTLQPKKKEE